MDCFSRIVFHNASGRIADGIKKNIIVCIYEIVNKQYNKQFIRILIDFDVVVVIVAECNASNIE